MDGRLGSIVDVEPSWVLVPGTLCTQEVFTPMLDHLGVARERRRHLVADAPTAGAYDAPLRTAAKGGEIVCGFSLGALVLAHNLDALKGALALVLLAANPFRDREGNRANREAERERILACGPSAWIFDQWTSLSTDRGDALRAVVAAMAEETVHLIDAQTELAASRPGAEKALVRTPLPLVFVTGSEDRVTPPELVRSLARKARSATLKVIDGLGHFALLEAPERVADAVSQGLSEVLPSRREKEAEYG